MSSVSMSSSLIILTVVMGASSIMVSDSATKAPLVFSKWPPYPNSKSPALRHQIFQHLRSSGRIPPNALVKRYPPAFMMRPMKYAQLKKTPIAQPSYYRPTISTPPRYRYHGPAAASNPEEYIFENPFNNMGFPPNKKKITLTDEIKYSPIHTVPAPNLNKNLAYSTHAEFIPDPLANAMDNQIFEQKDHFNQITFRPLTIPQYQVTEQISDNTIRVDPFTGKPKFYAPEPAQSIPTYKLSQNFDSFNQGNAVSSRPLPIEISFLPSQPQPQPQAQASTAPVASPFIQLANQVPQQQLPDTYALPIGSQPQLQQHLLQQQSMLQNVPVSVYNPTYLVTQSNNLLKQHREQLFKPAPAYLGTINQASIDLSPSNTQPLQDVNSVASPGQLLTSAQSQQKQAQVQVQAQQPQTLTSSVPLQTDFTPSVPQTDNGPTFQRYVADRPNNGVVVHQPVLTESELNNLLNIGHPEIDEQNRFVASTFFHAQPDPQVEIDNRERQKYNDIKIAKANEELKEKYTSAEVNIGVRKKSAHQEHQEKLAEHFSNKTPLRIYVPDEDYQKKNEVRRQDTFHVSTKMHYMMPRRDNYYRVNNQYLQDDIQIHETTTEANEDYLSHDTESVDRLALDGETREPISSSTIEYNY